jgi:hypothetical protein
VARSGTGHRWWCVAAGGALVVTAGACAAAPVSVEDFESSTGLAAPVQPVVAPATTGGRIPESFGPAAGGGSESPSDAPPIGFGDGATVTATALAGLGSERSLVRVVLYDGYGIVVAVAPNGDVDRVVIRGGGGEPPSPQPSATVRDAERERFAAADLDWGLVPALVERTPGDLGIDGGRVSHVIVEKNVPFSPDLVIRVYVSTERRSGRIDYYADGRPMRAFPG